MAAVSHATAAADAVAAAATTASIHIEREDEEDSAAASRSAELVDLRTIPRLKKSYVFNDLIRNELQHFLKLFFSVYVICALLLAQSFF